MPNRSDTVKLVWVLYARFYADAFFALGTISFILERNTVECSSSRSRNET